MARSVIEVVVDALRTNGVNLTSQETAALIEALAKNDADAAEEAAAAKKKGKVAPTTAPTPPATPPAGAPATTPSE